MTFAGALILDRHHDAPRAVQLEDAFVVDARGGRVPIANWSARVASSFPCQARQAEPASKQCAFGRDDAAA